MTAALPSDVVTVSHRGQPLRFVAPTPLVRHKIESLLTLEPTTIPWLESMAETEVFVDVGANVGLYSIFAALVSGAQVYAFEPESQNYATLNQNIYVNGLHERVTAYCLALSDRTEVSSLYLCTFEVGFGHHDFGENSWPDNLHRGSIVYTRDGRLRQGSLGMTLDELVESGAVPVPHHVKIDVDGLEWRVLRGAARTLRRPEVVSVLVETDFSISKNVDTIQLMLGTGWHFSEDQARVLRDETLAQGALKNWISSGAGQQNLIYYRDPERYQALFADFAESFSREDTDASC